MTDQPARQPTLFIPHGGGPCFFMDDPAGNWTGMGEYLAGIAHTLPAPPKAIIVVSGHWETDGFRFTGAARPDLLFDYYNFPPHTYELRYDAPGSPGLARRAAELLNAAGITAGVDQDRGLDHGVFIPLKMMFPDAAIPVIEMSVDRTLDPALHLAAGAALAPLRDEGVLIVGSGMSFHNMRGYGRDAFTDPSIEFDDWLTTAVEADAATRKDRLTRWSDAPQARASHPQEEHLIPLMVAAAASDGPGRRDYSELVVKTAISGYRFDS